MAFTVVLCRNNCSTNYVGLIWGKNAILEHSFDSDKDDTYSVKFKFRHWRGIKSYIWLECASCDILFPSHNPSHDKYRPIRSFLRLTPKRTGITKLRHTIVSNNDTVRMLSVLLVPVVCTLWSPPGAISPGAIFTKLFFFCLCLSAVAFGRG